MLALLVAGTLAAGTALADKPSHAGGKKAKQEQRGDHKGGGDHSGAHFGEAHRVALHDYYGEQYSRGRCPPGLAKKHNGCMPPGQAKKWNVGQPLPRDVIYYNVPASLTVQFGAPPAGHRYVRVASDILLIAIATGLVVAALHA